MAKIFLTPKNLAKRWHLSPITLRQWRWKGWGPQYLKLNRRIVYDLEDVEAYEKKRNSSLLPQKQASSISHSPDFSSLHFGSQVFLFPGVVQRHIVEILYEGWQSGHPKVRTQFLLEEAEAKSLQLAQIFKRHPNWKKIIGYSHGYCWLKI